MGSKKTFPKIFDGFLFPNIFRAFHMAIQPSKLLIAFGALAAISLAGWIMDFSHSVVVTAETKSTIGRTAFTKPAVSELDIYLRSPESTSQFIKDNIESSDRKGVFSTFWRFSSIKFNNAVNSLLVLEFSQTKENILDILTAVGWAVKYHFLYCLIFYVITLASISLSGGSICRISALQIAREEKPGITEAVTFGYKKFLSLFIAPVIPILIIIFMGLLIFVIGLITNIPWIGEIILAFSMPVALVEGVIITIFIIGSALGFALMFPAVAYDGCDCFDAISRSFSYIFERPWRMILYMILASFYGTVCYTFVRFFAYLLLISTRTFVQLGVWAQNAENTNKLLALWPKPYFTNLVGESTVSANWTGSVSAFLINLSILTVAGVVVAFIISYYFSVNTIIYAALRKTVDDTALSEVYADFEQDKV